MFMLQVPSTAADACEWREHLQSKFDQSKELRYASNIDTCGGGEDDSIATLVRLFDSASLKKVPRCPRFLDHTALRSPA